MPNQPTQATIDRARGPLSNWCKQAVLFAQMIRARDLGKPIESEHVPEAFKIAEDVFVGLMNEVGPIEKHPSNEAWMTAVADATFRWVQSHLDR